MKCCWRQKRNRRAFRRNPTGDPHVGLGCTSRNRRLILDPEQKFSVRQITLCGRNVFANLNDGYLTSAHMELTRKSSALGGLNGRASGPKCYTRHGSDATGKSHPRAQPSSPRRQRPAMTGSAKAAEHADEVVPTQVEILMAGHAARRSILDVRLQRRVD